MKTKKRTKPENPFKGLDPAIFDRAAELQFNRLEFSDGACYSLADAIFEFNHQSFLLTGICKFESHKYLDSFEYAFRPKDTFGLSTFWLYNCGDAILLNRDRRVMALLLCAELAKDANK